MPSSTGLNPTLIPGRQTKPTSEVVLELRALAQHLRARADEPALAEAKASLLEEAGDRLERLDEWADRVEARCPAWDF